MKYLKSGLVMALITLLFSGTLYASANARELVIIANKDYPLNSVSASVVKNIYLGEKTAEGGVKIKPMEQRDEAIKKRFIEKIMGSSVDGYKAYWIKKFFQEGVTPPTAKGTPSEIIQAISQTSGAIGYVWEDDLKDDSGVKTLLKIEVGN
ncbi:MAG TPA: hypothetical protein VFF47_04290 [Nitrospirota bacterium]|nr:hypothetical protein [Nitrospirota bacterium]